MNQAAWNQEKPYPLFRRGRAARGKQGQQNVEGYFSQAMPSTILACSKPVNTVLFSLKILTCFLGGQEIHRHSSKRIIFPKDSGHFRVSQSVFSNSPDYHCCFPKNISVRALPSAIARSCFFVCSTEFFRCRSDCSLNPKLDLS